MWGGLSLLGACHAPIPLHILVMKSRALYETPDIAELVYRSLEIVADAINEKDAKTAMTLLSQLDLKEIWKAGSPKAITPLGVITELARFIESDIYLELLASPEAIEIVENKAKQING